MSDLQAKYDALLRKFIGDQPLVPDDYDIQSAIHRDIEAARREKYQRQQDAIRNGTSCYE